MVTKLPVYMYILIMKDQLLQFVVLVFKLVTAVQLRSNRNLFEQNIIFHGYDATGRSFASTFDNDATVLQYCIVGENITIITHGWREEFVRAIWTQNMIANFSAVRGGCVFFMDYQYYSHGSYLSLYSNFRSITQVLTKKLNQLSQLGFDAKDFFLWGFSYGAHVMFEGAYKFGSRKVGRIDSCDPAGPGFPEYFGSALHARDSALFVQCVHTSSDKGTTGRYCPVNINMGKCGYSQPGSTSRPHLSHGLCPAIYNNAFNIDFSLVPVSSINDYFSTQCLPRKYAPDVRRLPNTTMGFRFNTSFPLGEYFALTKADSPYNVL